MSETLGVISDTERLANDLSSHDLIPYEVKDDVITTNLSRYQKASKLLNEVQRLLRHSNEPEIFMLQYCKVLMNLKNRALTRIVDDILMELGELVFYFLLPWQCLEISGSLSPPLNSVERMATVLNILGQDDVFVM